MTATVPDSPNRQREGPSGSWLDVLALIIAIFQLLGPVLAGLFLLIALGFLLTWLAAG